jgi:simple sugar transport system permease protein
MRDRLKSLIRPAIAIAISLAIGALILLVAGYDVGKAFLAIWNASFRNLRTITTTFNKASPLLYVGLAVAISFRGNVFNIGAEGQLLMGAVFATVVGLYLQFLPGFILITLMLLAGCLGGALWAFIPGYLKAKYDVSEVITTIMFNYIALNFIGYLVRGPLRDTTQAEPQSFAIARQGFLPSLIPGTPLHLGYLLGIVLSIGLFYLLFKTYIGYEVRAVGLNKSAANVAGVNVQKTIVGTMLISGALAGLGGAIELSNIHYLLEGISPGYGFTGIAVAILANSNPIGVIFSSFLFGFLNAGATSMQRSAGVSASFVQIFQGIMIVAIALATVSKTKITNKIKKTLTKDKNMTSTKEVE